MKVEYKEDRNAKFLKEIPLTRDTLLFALQRTDYLLSWSRMGIEISVSLHKDDWMTSFRVYPDEGTKSCQIIFYPYEKSDKMREKTGRDYQREVDDCIKFLQDFIENLENQDFTEMV